MNKRRKIAVITGSNTGMGKASVQMVAEKGYEVLMLVRDKKRGEEALRELQKDYPERLVMILCDLSDPSSVHRAAEMISEKVTHVDLLLNNAGLITTKRELTQAGVEMQFAVNYVGHFLLTLLLLPLMDQGSRIVQVASGAHKWGDIHFEDLTMEKSFRPFKAYGQSKLANVLFAEALSRRLLPYKITVNSCHPGAVGTSMGINRETGFGKGIMKILKPFFRTPKEGADTAVFLGTDPSVGNITGKYFYNRKPEKVSKRAADQVLSEKLFTWTEEHTGVFFQDLEKNLEMKHFERKTEQISGSI